MTKRKAAVFTPMSETDYVKYMGLALQQARFSSEVNEVPVGAVIVRDGDVIGRGPDQRMLLTDPTAHAEIMAIREASQYLGDWRLDDCTLFVTIEPCAMCAGAILLARIPLVVYGAQNQKFGACGSVCDLFCHDGWNHKVRTVGNVMADDAVALMQDWFRKNRR